MAADDIELHYKTAHSSSMYLDAEELGATFRTTEAAVYEWISTAPGCDLGDAQSA
ncbi:hypothetical protein M1M07_16330 [Rhodococcus sp. HM1]|uniref:hypothetical protein n=1 Tax=Rhodococcus sp. HM1 TaxID=2937759 RepID=UPI002009E32E|nr:hypothetical protein [Rhodococcus sp. HM1]MCK8672664.1 hypothetical protein [Rhodococcus sp. HM1]